VTPDPPRATWLGSDRLLARAVGRPILRFLHVEAAGGVLLVVAAVAAIVWASSPWKAAYSTLWGTDLHVGIGAHVLRQDLRHWLNDGLMAVFFFVIGLEIKNELVHGELREPRRAAVPVAAALGGMVVPVVLYLALCGGGAATQGWGVPMATDVAFALGVLALLGSRIPDELRVLLLALAIVDDVGAILVIAVFYASDVELGWLALAAAGLGTIVLLRRARVRYLPIYGLLALVVWWATFESGVHATIAGVALGLLTPARALLPGGPAPASGAVAFDGADDAAAARRRAFHLREAVPVTDRLVEVLHPWTSCVVLPLFALANAGVELSRHRLADAATSRVTLGIVVALVVGKAVGVWAGVALAVRTGIGSLPPAIRTGHVAGLALAAGIGFTVSIFVAGLAFDADELVEQAKVGILVASVLAAIAALVVLRVSSDRTVGSRGPAEQPIREAPGPS
jgi:NhaA family Na+:H+ antiporter